MAEDKGIGKLILSPNLKIDDIEVEADSLSTSADLLMGEWGRTVPIIKINDLIINTSCNLLNFGLKLSLNNLPVFNLTIDDDTFEIRNALINNIDKCVIFIGYQKFYFKFNGIIDKVSSRTNSDIIKLSGVWHNELLYESKQQVWKDKTILDILKDVCTETKMGLYVYDNPELNIVYEYIINPNLSNIEFISYLFTNYTKNLWCYDVHGFIHIGRLEEIKSDKIAKYTLNLKGETIPETDICFTNAVTMNGTLDTKGDGTGKETNKIKFDEYTHESEYTGLFFTSNKKIVSYSPSEELILSEDEFGVGNLTANTYSGFLKSKPIYYSEVINKSFGNTTKILLSYLMFELNIFDNVMLECFTEWKQTVEAKEDVEHSGKRTIMGMTFNFKPATLEDNNSDITQYIELL